MISQRFALLLLLAPLLAGCGFFVPDMANIPSTGDLEWVDENKIVNQIKCELAKGYVDARRQFPEHDRANDVDWLLNWGAKVTLKLTVDEKTSLAPGIALTKTLQNAVIPFPQNGAMTVGQSQSLGLGGTFSADGTRIETIGFHYLFRAIVNEHGGAEYIDPDTKCDNENGVLIHSDLKIREFIVNKLLVASVPGSVLVATPGGAKRVKTRAVNPITGDKPDNSTTEGAYDTFSYQVTFVVAYGLGITPTWKLVAFNANTSGTLMNVTRSKTHDVTITLGKVDDPAKATLTKKAEDQHLAALIGQAVAASIQSHAQQ
jgi:hypothetical protein